MANPVTAEFKGLDVLQKKLEALPYKIANKGLRKALKAGGNVIRAAISSQAPDRTGFLQQNINTRTKMHGHGDLAGSIFIGPSNAVYPKNLTARVLTETLRLSKKAQKAILKDQKGRIRVTSVARYLEFGTTKMSKRPFMTTAFAGSKDKALDALVEVLKEVIAAESK